MAARTTLLVLAGVAAMLALGRDGGGNGGESGVVSDYANEFTDGTAIDVEDLLDPGSGIDFGGKEAGEEGHDPTSTNYTGQQFDEVAERALENEQADNENLMSGVRL